MWPDEEANARCQQVRPIYVRELEPRTSTFKSLPHVAELDPEMVRHNREVIDRRYRRKPAAVESSPARKRKTG